MQHRIGDRHRPRLLCFLAFLFTLFLVGFAKPRDPRVTAIVVPDLGGESVESAAHRKLACNDCVVLLVARAEHQMRIATGPRARRWLTDDAAQRILDDRMRPLVREGHIEEAVDAGVFEIEKALPQANGDAAFAWGIAGFVLLFGFLLVLNVLTGGIRKKGDSGEVPPVHFDTSSSGGFGGGGASSSW